MITIRNSAALERAVNDPIDPTLKELLVLRKRQLTEHDGYDIGDLAHFLIAHSAAQRRGDPLDHGNGGIFHHPLSVANVGPIKVRLIAKGPCGQPRSLRSLFVFLAKRFRTSIVQNERK